MAAAPAKDQVAEYGDVVVPGNALAATHAVRARLDDAAIARPAVDADVQEAAYQEAEEEGEQRFDHFVSMIMTGLGMVSPG